MLRETTVKTVNLNLRVNAEAKEIADKVLENIGLTFNEAVNMLLYQVCAEKDLPAAIKQRLPIELDDGHGSYICEYGHIHDYSKFDFEVIEREISDPNTKQYTDLNEMWADLEKENEEDDDKI